VLEGTSKFYNVTKQIKCVQGKVKINVFNIKLSLPSVDSDIYI